MSKMRIIILAAVGVLCFAGSFVTTWLVKKSRPPLPQAVVDATAAKTPTEQIDGGSGTDLDDYVPQMAAMTAMTPARLERGMTEKQLQSLIFDIREKMKEYQFREGDLEKQEKRIAVSRTELTKDIDKLETLSTQLSILLADLKAQEQSLEKTRIKIEAQELKNLTRQAAIYDKMDPKQSGPIVANMMAGQQSNDAVKLVYYMTERTAAELIGEIATKDPIVATKLSIELKKVTQTESE